MLGNADNFLSRFSQAFACEVFQTRVEHFSDLGVYLHPLKLLRGSELLGKVRLGVSHQAMGGVHLLQESVNSGFQTVVRDCRLSRG